MSEKRYTAQEMRDTAQCLHYNSPTKLTIEAAAMLRQAAIDAVELAKYRSAYIGLMTGGGKTNAELIAENAELNARLEAVVKECENQIPECRLDEGKCSPQFDGYCDNCEVEPKIHGAIIAILRAARGEGGAE